MELINSQLIINKNFFDENQKILITGGTGLVGSGINRVLQKSIKLNGKNNIKSFFVFVSSKDGDLSDVKQCENLFKLHKPSHVIHLAAFVGGLYRNLKKPVDFWTLNVAINNNVLMCAHKFKVKKVISCLSTCIFPNETNYPIDETMIHKGPPHHSNETYSYAKRMVDVLNRAYSKQYGNLFTSIIPTNIYGPCDNYSLEDSHVIPGLIHKCYLAKKNNTCLKVLGTGKPLRQFIYSEDLAILILNLLQVYDDINPVILSTDEKDEISIKKVLNLIVRNIGFKGEIIWDDTKSDGQFKKTANNTKMRKLFPNFKFTTIENGIKKTCEWFIENYNIIRK